MNNLTAVFANSAEVFEAIHSKGNRPDPAKTLANWQLRVIDADRAIKVLKNAVDAKAAEMRETYSEKVVTEAMTEANATMGELIQTEKSRFAGELAEVLDGKMERYKSVALRAPSDGQLRLLTALNLRADTLTPAEVRQIAIEMANNHQAVKTLAAIAQKAGLTVIPPPSVEDVADAFETARNYATESLEALGTDIDAMTYRQRCFYESPGDFGYSALLTHLDTETFTTVQVDESQPEKTEVENDPVNGDAVEKALDNAQQTAQALDSEEQAPERKAQQDAARAAQGEATLSEAAQQMFATATAQARMARNGHGGGHIEG